MKFTKIKWTILKYIFQWHLVHFQCCVNITSTYPQSFSISPTAKSLAKKQFPLLPPPYSPLETRNGFLPSWWCFCILTLQICYNFYVSWENLIRFIENILFFFHRKHFNTSLRMSELSTLLTSRVDCLS